MLRKRNRMMEQRVAQIRDAVTDRWDKLSARDVQMLSDTLNELRELLEQRTAGRQRRVNLEPVLAAYATQRDALDGVVTKAAEQLGKRTHAVSQQAGRITKQTGETFRTKPLVAALVGAGLGLLVMTTVGRRYLE